MISGEYIIYFSSLSDNFVLQCRFVNMNQSQYVDKTAQNLADCSNESKEKKILFIIRHDRHFLFHLN